MGKIVASSVAGAIGAMLSAFCNPRVLLVLAFLASITALLVRPQPALADVIIPKPKPQPRPPRPQPPLPKPPPPLPPPEPDDEQPPVRNIVAGLSASLGVCLLGLWLARRNRQNRAVTVLRG